MKKLQLVLISILTVAAVVMGGTPAYAIFVNGGFETGDFTGWTLEFGHVEGDGDPITWGQSNHGKYAVINSSGTQSGQTLDVNPYYGTYMARINDIDGSFHATRLSQTDTVTQADLDSGANLSVKWGAMLIEPSNTHGVGDQPFFGINVYKNSVLQDSFYADALNHNIDPSWILAGDNGGDLWYKTETWNYNISGYNVGDQLEVEMFAADCGLGAHGGYAFLDGIGTQNPDEPEEPVIPEPASMLLFGTGLIGLVGLRKKK